MEEKKVAYIAGPITGVDKYWETFEAADDELRAAGYITLNPAQLPPALDPDARLRIEIAMIDSADAVCVLPGSHTDEITRMEVNYSRLRGKDTIFYKLEVES